MFQSLTSNLPKLNHLPKHGLFNQLRLFQDRTRKNRAIIAVPNTKYGTYSIFTHCHDLNLLPETTRVGGFGGTSRHLCTLRCVQYAREYLTILQLFMCSKHMFNTENHLDISRKWNNHLLDHNCPLQTGGDPLPWWSQGSVLLNLTSLNQPERFQRLLTGFQDLYIKPGSLATCRSCRSSSMFRQMFEAISGWWLQLAWKVWVSGLNHPKCPSTG